ncbi:MAG: hypothetical protein NWR72_11015 [Bacteroidia bacterium]|nr:hypothetical protein [Bacteroidia bacterium]
MPTTLLQAVTVVDPGSQFHGQVVDIELSATGISRIDATGTFQSGAAQIIDGNGTFVSPGWVDVGASLCDPGEEWKETQMALSMAAIKGGFTTLLPYPTSIPIADNADTIIALNARMGQLPIHIYPIGAATEHRHGQEMADLFEMHTVGIKAFSDGPTAFSQEGTLTRVLRYLQGFDGLLMTGGISSQWATEGFMHEGEMSTRLGMPAIPAVMEKIAVQRDIEILEYVGKGRIHFHPLSTPQAIEQVQMARQRGLDVSIGVPTYLFAWTDEDMVSFDENLKLIPPLRSKAIVSEISALLASGSIDILCSGHRAEGLEEKHVEFMQAAPGMLNLQTAYSQVQQALISTGIITLEDWVRMISTGPRARFGLEQSNIMVGGQELTWFSPDQTWTLTKSGIPSRAKNSPHLEATMVGKSLGVFVKGYFHLNY